MKEKIYMKYCPRCGDIDWSPHSNLNANKNENVTCSVCGYQLKTIDPKYDLYDEYEYNGTFSHFQEMSQRVELFFEEVIKPNPEFDPDLYARKDEIIKRKQEQEMNEFRRQTCGASWVDDKIGHKPKCPTCGSTNIKPITTGERIGSVMMLGMFSKKINKSFKCLECKYTW